MAPKANLRVHIGLVMLTLLSIVGCGEHEAETAPEISAPSVNVPALRETDGQESGESMTPEGEYRPADEQGPAQNVPKPVKPEGMNEETAAGLEKFILYWNDCVNYGIQTGDFSYAKPLISEDYATDHEFYIWAEEIYKRGGWIVGGRREAVLGEGRLAAQGNGVYIWGGNLNVEDIQAYLDGPGAIGDGSYSRGKEIQYVTNFVNGAWQIVGVETVE